MCESRRVNLCELSTSYWRTSGPNKFNYDTGVLVHRSVHTMHDVYSKIDSAEDFLAKDGKNCKQDCDHPPVDGVCNAHLPHEHDRRQNHLHLHPAPTLNSISPPHGFIRLVSLAAFTFGRYQYHHENARMMSLL